MERSRVREISTHESVAPDLWKQEPLVAIHTAGERRPLIITQTWLSEMHHIQNLGRHLGPDRPVYGIAPPTGQSRADYPSDLSAWASFCLPWIRRIQPDGPYLLAGWSLGGLIAFEAARQLAAQGEPIGRVVLFDSWVPRPQPRQSRSRPHEIVHYLDEMLDLPPRARGGYARALLRRLWQRESQRLRRRKRRPVVEFAEVPLLLRAIRVSYLKYAPAPSRLPVTLFWCDDARERAGDLSLGWHPYLRGDFESLRTPGCHRTLFDEPHVALLAARLAAVLDRAEEPDQTPST